MHKVLERIEAKRPGYAKELEKRVAEGAGVTVETLRSAIVRVWTEARDGQYADEDWEELLEGGQIIPTGIEVARIAQRALRVEVEDAEGVSGAEIRGEFLRPLIEARAADIEVVPSSFVLPGSRMNRIFARMYGSGGPGAITGFWWVPCV